MDFGEQIKNIRNKEKIKGEENMNNMTQKIINDGSATKRAKYNMITTGIGTILLLIGVMFLIIKGLSVEYTDTEGILHENFFLIPCGFFCIFCGCIVFLSMGVRTVFTGIKDKQIMY